MTASTHPEVQQDVSRASPTRRDPRRFQIADAFIVTTGVAVTFAIATVIVPGTETDSAVARLTLAVALLPLGLSLSGLFAIRRQQRRPADSGEWNLVAIPLTYSLPIGSTLVGSSLPQHSVNIVVIAAALLEIGGLVGVLTVLVFTAQQPKTHRPWTHRLGIALGLLIIPTLLLLVIAAG